MTATDALVKMYAEQFVKRFEHIEGHWTDPIVNAMDHPHQNIAGNAYRGCNRTFLPIISSQRGFRLPLWMTIPQMNDLGVYVRKGESGYPVSFTDFFIKNSKEPGGCRITVEEYDKMTPLQRQEQGLVKIYRTKWYKVFNIDQTTFADVFPNSMEELYRIFGGTDGQHINSALLDTMITEDGWLCPIKTGSECAVYNKDNDVICIPTRELFVDDRAYYNTLLRLMAESTGSEMRLDRGIWTDVKGDIAMEALVCELSAASMGALLGIGVCMDPASEQYVKKWITDINANPEFIYGAVQEASRTTDCLADVLGLNMTNGVDITQVIAKQYTEAAQNALKKKELRVTQSKDTITIHRQRKPRTGRRL